MLRDQQLKKKYIIQKYKFCLHFFKHNTALCAPDALPCPACSVDCNAALAEARDARRVALAARDRFVARNARLQRRKAERDAARRPPPGVASTQAAALPSAAADALARALAKAKERRG